MFTAVPTPSKYERQDCNWQNTLILCYIHYFAAIRARFSASRSDKFIPALTFIAPPAPMKCSCKSKKGSVRIPKYVKGAGWWIQFWVSEVSETSVALYKPIITEEHTFIFKIYFWTCKNTNGGQRNSKVTYRNLLVISRWGSLEWYIWTICNHLIWVQWKLPGFTYYIFNLISTSQNCFIPKEMSVN